MIDSGAGGITNVLNEVLVMVSFVSGTAASLWSKNAIERMHVSRLGLCYLCGDLQQGGRKAFLPLRDPPRPHIREYRTPWSRDFERLVGGALMRHILWFVFLDSHPWYRTVFPSPTCSMSPAAIYRCLC